ncbi:MAG: hypothetical protein EA419_07050 [Wenzhouxiangella sp.]|nr:MAG: hypothetical protein EA419_07050 [Wenzhouxiangella sp.]
MHDHKSLHRWAFGAARFDESSLHLTIAGQAVKLEPKPLKLLALLLRHAGEVVTREEIVEDVWEGRITVDHALSTAVGKLRQALGEIDEVTIETVPRAGYRLAGPVRRTAVGRVPANRLELRTGDPVPGRPGLELVKQIGSTLHNEIWLARGSAHRPEARARKRVFKFAAAGERLANLKREAALSRHLEATLGRREDIAFVVETNFSEPPFFLEYQHCGENLRRWAEHGDDFAGLPRSARIELFLKICRVVADAHGVGVLHRDIKPENILISEEEDGACRAVLADFGSSEMLEPEQLERLSLSVSGLTVTRDDGSSSGTLIYMAPELLQTGVATVQSDVFALGILLYQMVIGDFRQTMTPGWRREIDDELLIEDIAAATDLDPERRLSSVGELERRLSRLATRADERARQRSDKAALLAAREQMERTRERRPWIIALVASLALGVGISVHLYRDAQQGREAAEAYGRSMQSVQQFLSDDIIARADPLNPDFSREAGIESILELAARGVDARFADDPMARAGLHRILGNIFRTLRRDDLATAHLERAQRLYADQLGEPSSAALVTAYELAWAHAFAGQLDPAEHVLQQADRARAGRAEPEPDVEYRRAVAYGYWHANGFRSGEALAAFQTALDLFPAIDTAAPRDRGSLALSIADAYLRLGEPLEARKVLDEQASLHESLLEEKLFLASFERISARVERALENYPEALELARRAARALEEIYGEAHYQTITTLSIAASIEALLEDCEATLATSTRVAALMEQSYGADHLASLVERGNLGGKQFNCGFHDQGIANVERAVAGISDAEGPDFPTAQTFRFFLAGFLNEAGRYDEALALLDDLSGIALTAAQSSPVREEQITLRRARSLAGLGRIAQATEKLQALFERVLNEDDDPDLLSEIERELALLNPATL